jgi:hypothetical protein
VMPHSKLIPTLDAALKPHGVSWTVPLRTAHVVAGFLPIPPPARSAYPPLQTGEKEAVVLPGRWFETGERLWLWLNRRQDRFFGPELANQLAWCEAGDLLHVDWTPDIIVLRLTGRDSEIQQEETRLVDAQALAALRAGLGESYRHSLQALLAATPDGMNFMEVIAALRQRQGHSVHRGTVRALLSAGGFVQHHGRWFASPLAPAGARQLRAAIITALVPEQTGTALLQPAAAHASLRAIAGAIQERLSELIGTLRKRPENS